MYQDYVFIREYTIKLFYFILFSLDQEQVSHDM